MSTYKFTLNKRHIMEADDSSQFAPDAWSYGDSTDEARSKQDIDVAVYLDAVLKHTVTLTDSGATLQFDADVSVGEHTIAIKAPKSPIQQTNICVDQFFIGSTLAVASHWDYNNQVSGTTSTLRQKLATHQHMPHDYVWWGAMVNNDSTLNLNNIFYRPGIVSNHQGEWHMTFTKASNGTIWISQPGDVEHILWDSTAQHTYYFVAKGTDQDTVDAAYTKYQGEHIDDTIDSGSDSTATQVLLDNNRYLGPGTYKLDGNYLQNVSGSIDTTEDANNIVLVSLVEFFDAVKNHWYHRNYTVTPITVT